MGKSLRWSQEPLVFVAIPEERPTRLNPLANRAHQVYPCPKKEERDAGGSTADRAEPPVAPALRMVNDLKYG